MGASIKVIGVFLLTGGLWLGLGSDGFVYDTLTSQQNPWAKEFVQLAPERVAEPGGTGDQISQKEKAEIISAKTTPSQVGLTTKEVTENIGTPTKGSGMNGKQMVWFYHKRTITFQNGKVVSDIKHD